MKITISMGRTPNVVHETRPYMDGSPRSHVYRPGPETAGKGSLMVVSEGLYATPDEYLRMARELGILGYTVVVPDCTEPAPNNTSTDAFGVREDVIRYATEDAFEAYREVDELDSVVFAGHSMSAAIQARVMAKPPDVPVSGLVSINGAGNAKLRAPNALSYIRQRPHLAKGFLRASVGVVGNTIRNPRSIPSRLDLPRTLREATQVIGLNEGHNLEYYEMVQAAGGFILELTGPRDDVIDAEETMRVASPVIGRSNVVPIHPKANHFGPQSHPRHTARRIDEEVSIRHRIATQLSDSKLTLVS